MSGIIDLLKNLKSKQQENSIKNKNIQSHQNIFKGFFNQINRFADEILTLKEPEVYTIAKENNIACKYQDIFVLTRDNNLTIGIELKGASYSALSLENELSFLDSRVSFFQKLNSNLELKIVIQKEKLDENTQEPLKSSNIFVNEIADKWNANPNVYKIKYFLLFSTLEKKITGALESFKQKATTEDNNQNASLSTKINLLNEVILECKSKLANFEPRVMQNDEILNFYASYGNGNKTNLSYTHELLSDCYITSNVEFKKDYFIYYRNDGTSLYARFLSIKAYETESIKSLITSNTIKDENEFLTFITIIPFSKEKAKKKIKDTRAFLPQIAREELDELLELVEADRENLMQVSYSMLLSDTSLEKLEDKSNLFKGLLESQGLSIVRETINQRALFFSFFPSRSNLNARLKPLKISNVATIATFENEISGFNKNDWGNSAVTHFKHLNGTPYLFNFHWTPNGDKPSGHTMIIGGTGAGKTTLAQFLMCNLFKYNIDIFSMDKLRGMYAFTQYSAGEYHDSSEDFKFNPFSLSPTQDNKEFLISWLCAMAQIPDNDYVSINEVQKTLQRFFDNKQEGQIITLSNFVGSIPIREIQAKFQPYLKSIFDNQEDALNFNRQLSILNMDSILNNKKLASLSAIYLFHKLKTQAKNNTEKQGFFCFIDELKDYLNDPVMSEKILEAILEVRKIGGVMCFGFQSLSLFDNLEKGNAFLDNIANYIVFPTNSESAIEEMREKIGLQDHEAHFLQTTPQNARQVLLKMPLRNESAILNVDLSKLNNHLKVFSSSSNNVNLIKRLKKEHPNEWRKYYLNSEEADKEAPSAQALEKMQEDLRLQYERQQTLQKAQQEREEVLKEEKEKEEALRKLQESEESESQNQEEKE